MLLCRAFGSDRVGEQKRCVGFLALRKRGGLGITEARTLSLGIGRRRDSIILVFGIGNFSSYFSCDCYLKSSKFESVATVDRINTNCERRREQSLGKTKRGVVLGIGDLGGTLPLTLTQRRPEKEN